MFFFVFVKILLYTKPTINYQADLCVIQDHHDSVVFLKIKIKIKKKWGTQGAERGLLILPAPTLTTMLSIMICYILSFQVYI